LQITTSKSNAYPFLRREGCNGQVTKKDYRKENDIFLHARIPFLEEIAYRLQPPLSQIYHQMRSIGRKKSSETKAKILAIKTNQFRRYLWTEINASKRCFLLPLLCPLEQRRISDTLGINELSPSHQGGIYMQKITPHLWFDKEAKEAAEFYTSVFRKSKIKDITKLHDTPSGTAEIVTIDLMGQEFVLLSAGPFFKFNEAISFIVHCDTQAEIDYYWEKLSAVPEAEQCGWLKDKYGLSWQIVPTALGDMLKDKDKSKVARVTEAFLKMKKFDIATLQRAHRGG
jgi:predicted 3-demethylubiquinone-9 3-methyltransferase (glyoxalase superfamily)